MKFGELAEMIECCVILHNIMVEVRTQNNEEDDIHLYDVDDSASNSNVIESEAVRQVQLQNELLHAFEEGVQETVQRTGFSVYDENVIEMRKRFDNQTFLSRVMLARWNALNDDDAHNKLRNAIISHLSDNEVDEANYQPVSV